MNKPKDLKAVSENTVGKGYSDNAPAFAYVSRARLPPPAVCCGYAALLGST